MPLAAHQVVAAPMEFEDDDVLSSEDEDMQEDGEGEISDDSEDLMAAAANGHGRASSDEDAASDDEPGSSAEGQPDDGDDELEEGSDDDQEAGPGAHATAGQAHPKHTPGRTSDGLTADEHDMLLMAQATSDAAVMQMQVTELIKETRATLPATDQACLGKDLAQLRKVLQAISPHKVSGDRAAGFIRDLGLSPAAVSLPFQPPLVVAAVGSLPLGAAMVKPGEPGQGITLDVAVVMPSACFFRKAHLNYRYHAMRALYLATLTNHLAASPAFAGRSMHLETLQHDPTRPVLVISAAAGTATPSPYHLRLIPCCSPNTFPLPRLQPDRNGVRWVRKRPSNQPTAADNNNNNNPSTGQQPASQPPGATVTKPASTAAGGADRDAQEEAQYAATPTYNMSILTDMLVLPHASILQRTSQAVPAFADGWLLLKVWAHQNGLFSGTGSADGVDGHALGMLLAHLAEQGKLAASMSPLQVFRCGLQALAGTDPTSNVPKGIAMTHMPVQALEQALHAAAPHLLFPGHLGAPTAAHTAPSSHPPTTHLLATLADVALGKEPTSPDTKKKPSTVFNGAPNVSVFKKAHPAMLVDPLGWCNCLYLVSKPALAGLGIAAKASLNLLNTPLDSEAALASVLLSPARAAALYDYMWGVQVRDHPTIQPTKAAAAFPGHKDSSVVVTAAAAGQEGAEHWVNSCVGDVCAWREQEAAVEALIRAALTDRAHLVRALRRPVPPAPITALQQGLLQVKQPQEVLVGARVAPLLALRLVDVGPAADDVKGAARFREFWGPAAELRRFQDGKISEAVVWGGAGTGPGSRHAIPDQAVAYALQRHKPAAASGAVRCCATALDSVLRSQDDDTADAAIVSERLLEAATEKLSKQLRELEGLPLKVVAVQALSAAARHTAVFPPAPHPLAGGVPSKALGAALASAGRLPRCLQPQELLVQLENSGRWPSNPAAFAKMKAALGVQLAKVLHDSAGLHTQATEEYVEVLSEGFAFRLQLYSGRDEAMLLEQSSAVQSKQGPASKQAASPETQPLIRSWHHGLIARVGGANTSFAPACRLAKRWVASHLLSEAVCEEAVEIMVAAAYASQGPKGAPGSRMAGLLRFLHLVSQHPWAVRPLVVDPDNTLDAAAHKRVQQRFTEQRALPCGGGALPALYLVTPRDLTSQHWTRDKPSPAAVTHMSSLARTCLEAACQLLESGPPGGAPPGAMLEDGPDQSEATEAALLGALFTPQLQQYDLLVQLRQEGLPQASQALPAWLNPAPKRARQPDVLSHVMEGATKVAPPAKRARAFLDAFPDKAVQSRGPASLRDELLVGFNPVPHFIQELQSHLLGQPHHRSAAGSTAGASSEAEEFVKERKALEPSGRVQTMKRKILSAGPLAEAEAVNTAVEGPMNCLQKYAQLFTLALQETAAPSARGPEQVHISLRLHEPAPVGTVGLAWAAEPARLTIPDTYTAGDVLALASVQAGGSLVAHALFRKPVQKELDEATDMMPCLSIGHQQDFKVRMRDTDVLSAVLTLGGACGSPALGSATQPLELWVAVQPHGMGVLRTACGYVLKSANAGMRTSGVRGSRTALRIPSSLMTSPSGKKGTSSSSSLPAPSPKANGSPAADRATRRTSTRLAHTTRHDDASDSEATQDETAPEDELMQGQEAGNGAAGEADGQQQQGQSSKPRSQTSTRSRSHNTEPAVNRVVTGKDVMQEQPSVSQTTLTAAAGGGAGGASLQPEVGEQHAAASDAVGEQGVGVQPMSLGPFSADLDALLQPGGLTTTNIDTALAAIMAIANAQLAAQPPLDPTQPSQADAAPALPECGENLLASSPQAAGGAQPRWGGVVPKTEPLDSNNPLQVLAIPSTEMDAGGNHYGSKRPVRPYNGPEKRLKKLQVALKLGYKGRDDDDDESEERAGRGKHQRDEDDDEAAEVAQTLMSVREGRHLGRVQGERRVRVKYSHEEVHAILDGLLSLREAQRETAWATIKRESGLVLSKRSNVDLKDKWRNLQLQWYKNELPAELAAKVMRAKAKADHPGPWPDDMQW